MTLGTNKSAFEQKTLALVEPTFLCFQQIVKKYFYFHLIFSALIALETLCLVVFFFPLAESHFIGIMLALTFFTVLLYFILRTYWQEQKPSELASLRNEYIDACKEFVPQKDGATHHLSLASAVWHMISYLDGKEKELYKLPKAIRFAKPLVEKCSIGFHWDDVHTIKELFLISSINEHLKFIRNEPTNVEAHAATANAYTSLSALYLDPNTHETGKKSWFLSQKKLNELQKKYRESIERSIEELKIVREFAQSEPWVRKTLAKNYNALDMTAAEIGEYEAILELEQNDLETLFRLGYLYFQQGANAKGLKVYDTLKNLDAAKGHELIQHYGAYAIK